ncbi:hypothetical protein [Dactylosporangium sp. CA-092794]|uniref:hypothetical protein n=1 Tax=Dactylosporangium sp. CA-092794 TaxID=3239929 RepID=UPI003D94383B
MFLSANEVARLFAALSGRAATGSTLGLTVEVHPAGVDSNLVLSTADRIMFGGTSPLHAIMSRESWTGLLGDAGWTVQNLYDRPRTRDRAILAAQADARRCTGGRSSVPRTVQARPSDNPTPATWPENSITFGEGSRRPWT